MDTSVSFSYQKLQELETFFLLQNILAIKKLSILNMSGKLLYLEHLLILLFSCFRHHQQYDLFHSFPNEYIFQSVSPLFKCKN